MVNLLENLNEEELKGLICIVRKCNIFIGDKHINEFDDSEILKMLLSIDDYWKENYYYMWKEIVLSASGILGVKLRNAFKNYLVLSSSRHQCSE